MQQASIVEMGKRKSQPVIDSDSESNNDSGSDLDSVSGIIRSKSRFIVIAVEELMLAHQFQLDKPMNRILSAQSYHAFSRFRRNSCHWLKRRRNHRHAQNEREDNRHLKAMKSPTMYVLN